jgi:hypothetical protein
MHAMADRTFIQFKIHALLYDDPAVHLHYLYFIVVVYRNIVKRHTGTAHGQAEGNALERKCMSG